MRSEVCAGATGITLFALKPKGNRAFEVAIALLSGLKFSSKAMICSARLPCICSRSSGEPRCGANTNIADAQSCVCGFEL